MKFKKGDKVLIYGHYPNNTDWGRGFSYARGELAKVTFITADDEINVKDSKGKEYEVHPMQCRKVKK